jgi:hypothetical protein
MMSLDLPGVQKTTVNFRPKRGPSPPATRLDLLVPHLDDSTQAERTATVDLQVRADGAGSTYQVHLYALVRAEEGEYLLASATGYGTCREGETCRMEAPRQDEYEAWVYDRTFDAGKERYLQRIRFAPTGGVNILQWR